MKQAVLGALVLLSTISFAESATPALIGNIGGRTTISLDGVWNSIVDPYETGLGSRFYDNAKPKTKSDLIEYDFDRSPKLKVPGDWNSQRESLLFYEGPVWYQRYFSYQKRAHVRTFLYFGAANYQARVWLNGRKLGEHVGGFTPFQFEVTDQLVEAAGGRAPSTLSQNSLVVEVDNTRRIDGVPGLHTDWWNYGGLTRGVKLVEVPETFIENYSVQLAKGKADVLEGWVQFNGSAHRSDVAVEIPEIHFKQTARVNASGRAELNWPQKVEPWSPDNPRLYHVVISAEGESVADDIGFRTIETRGTQILLNGKPIFLRGICLHEEAPFRGGRAFSEEDDRALLAWAKELGANFVRLAHYPHNEDMLRLADRMGIAVWEEVPVYWDISWQNPGTLENAKSQLREIVSRDQNRAAILLWSLSNETPLQPGRIEFLKALGSYTRQLDSTRLITSAMNHTENSGTTRNLSDPLGDVVDVLGLNEYLGWYEGRPEDADRMNWQTAFQKPLIVSEFGGGAVYGLHGDSETRFSEEYQANLFEHQLGMIQRMPGLAGITPWVLMDFRSPRRTLAGVQDFYNRKGVVSDRGQKKQAFYVLQKFYREKAAEASARH